ncbi:MAG: type I glyceraldehyde-3-phosphate dehydrogenase, partial [Bacilli bacterium]
TELTAIVEDVVSVEDVNNAMKNGKSDSFGYTEEELVSSDIIGSTYGSLFDATQTKVMDLSDGTTLVKIAAWYDNEMSYSTQMVRIVKCLGKLLK